MNTAIELLRELAALKRYGKGDHPNRSSNHVTVNVTTNLMERIDALLAQPEPSPYAYEVGNELGESELIYAQAATKEDFERPYVELYLPV